MNAAEDRYQALFDANPDPIVVLDREGRALAANSAARAFLDPAGTHPRWADASAGSEVDLQRLGFVTEPFAEVVARVEGSGPTTWEIEIAVPTSTPELSVPATVATGTAPRVLEVRLSRLPVGTRGEGTDFWAGAYLWIAHDVTDRVRLERTRQDLTYMIVHDLRVPLGNILNSLDLVLSAWREQDITIPVVQILEIGLRSARRMEQLVNDILDSARLRAKKRPLVVAEISVFQMVSEAVEAVGSSAARRGQILRVSVQPDLPPMQGDPDLLGRVLVNLLSNAVKFVQEGGEILLRAWVDAEVFRFTVSDNGPGIAGQDQAAIFELYWRGDAQRATGAGIGLAFCRLAVAAHGGRIWLDSTLGQGASFNFTIPRVLPKSAVFHQETGV